MRLPHFLSISAASLLACGSLALAQTAVVTSTSSTTSDGTISEFSPDTLVIRSTTSPEPIHYSYSKTTTYVDDSGAPVSMEVVKSGLPVTVQYVHEGDHVVANRVIVHKRTTTVAPAAVEERKTVTTAVPVPAPVAVERSSTTTTTTTK